MADNGDGWLEQLYELILQRKRNRPPGSYVAQLMEEGQDHILRKVTEEAGEVLLASKNQKADEIIWEMADLWFHSLLVLGWHEIPPQKVIEELKRRHQKQTNKQT